VSIRYGEDIVAGQGTKLYAGNICFEADRRTYVSSSQIVCCISRSNKKGTTHRAAPLLNTSFTSITSFTRWRDYFTISFLTMFTCSPLMRTK
jgi:hypothetical protein